MSADTDYVTELDMYDPEKASAFDMIECPECGEVDERISMVEQYAGEYLCGPCHYKNLRDYHDDLASMMFASRP